MKIRRFDDVKEDVILNVEDFENIKHVRKFLLLE